MVKLRRRGEVVGAALALFALRDAGDANEGSPHVGARHVGSMDELDPREQVALLKEELAKKEALIELAALKAQLQEKDSVLAAIEQSGGRPTSPTRPPARSSPGRPVPSRCRGARTRPPSSRCP